MANNKTYSASITFDFSGNEKQLSDMKIFLELQAFHINSTINVLNITDRMISPTVKIKSK